MTAPVYLTIARAADLLGVSRYSVWRMVRRRLIPFVQYPVGGVRISTVDLETFREKCRRGAVATLPTRSHKTTRAQLRVATDALAARAKRTALARLGRTQ